jgi:hypothetical protein
MRPLAAAMIQAPGSSEVDLRGGVSRRGQGTREAEEEKEFGRGLKSWYRTTAQEFKFVRMYYPQR